VEVGKKKYSLTIHYRNCEHQNIFLDDLLDNPFVLKDFEVKNGDKVFNIFSTNSPNKGTSVIHLFHEFHFNKIFYIGDDLTDEDVFQIKDERIISIKIGDPKNTKAKYNILLQKEIDIYLEKLIEIMSKKF
jgi:trehalose 6-phosphate phosphatase